MTTDRAPLAEAVKFAEDTLQYEIEELHGNPHSKEHIWRVIVDALRAYKSNEAKP